MVLPYVKKRIAWNKGIKYTPKQRAKFKKYWDSLKGVYLGYGFQKGHPYGKRFEKGQTPWNKGIPCSEETKRKLSKANKGNLGWSKGTKGILKANKSSFKKGNKPWNKGLPKEMQPTYGKKRDLRKEKHPRWKGGITPYVMQLRNSDRYKQWRNDVFKRDNYTCQTCGDNRGHNLNAHHIIPFAECLDLNWEEEIFDIDNGLTLCKNCHERGDING